MNTTSTPFWGKDKPSVRQPRFADNMWYSSQPFELRNSIQTYLDQVTTAPNINGLLGLVSPHAGHLFSGHVAATAFASLSPGDFETVILIGPDHHGVAMSDISTVQVDAWRTPLGEVSVDWGMLQAIQKEIQIELVPTDREHSLEIQLPFLQMTLQQFNFVPIMIGLPSMTTCRRLGDALAKVITSKTLLVASSDLSHFFNDAVARQLDETTLKFVLDMDETSLLQHAQSAVSSACGVGAITTIIYTSKLLGTPQAKLLKYATSGDVPPYRKDRVVGYAAVAFCRE